jgi:hypothetical protein
MSRPVQIGLIVAAVVFGGCTASSSGGNATGREHRDAAASMDAASSAAGPSSAAGCALPVLPTEPSDSSDQIIRRGGPAYPAILASGERLESIGSAQSRGLAVVAPKGSPAGVPLRAVLFDDTVPADADFAPGHRSVRLYYARDPIELGTTISDLYRDGGVYLSESEMSGQDAKLVVETVGDAAEVNQVGPFDAALVLSSPFSGGFRTWNLYWSDGKVDYALIGNVAPEDLIAFAQAMFC